MLGEYYNVDTQTLTIPFNFNEELIDLPSNTIKIIFEQNYKLNEYSKFNRPIGNILPLSLTHLIFGGSFNQSVDNLPLTLTHLTFGNIFNCLVDDLPNSLMYLTFGSNFNKSVNKLPSALIHLSFG